MAYLILTAKSEGEPSCSNQGRLCHFHLLTILGLSRSPIVLRSITQSVLRNFRICIWSLPNLQDWLLPSAGAALFLYLGPLVRPNPVANFRQIIEVLFNVLAMFGQDCFSSGN